MNNSNMIAEQLMSSLEEFLKGLQKPLDIALEMKDEILMQMIRDMILDCIIKIDHEIAFYLHQGYGIRLKSLDTEGSGATET